MLHKFITGLAWACLAFIVYATLSPGSHRPELTASETGLTVLIEHLGAFGLLGFLFAASHPKKPIVVCAIVLGSAILLELLQLLVPDRDARIIDAVQNWQAAALEYWLDNGCLHLFLH
jgi:VanZ family protein